MKGNKKLYSSLFFLAILFLALLLLLLGSFWDLPIAKGMFQKIGDAGPFLSPIVSLPGYILFALSGAMLVSSFSLSNKPIIQKILIKSPIFLTPIISLWLLLFDELSFASTRPIGGPIRYGPPPSLMALGREQKR